MSKPWEDYAASATAVSEPVQETKPWEDYAQTQQPSPQPLAPEFKPATTLGELPSVMFGMPEESKAIATAETEARKQFATPQQAAETADAISRKWDAIIQMTRESRPENVPAMIEARNQELRSVGSEPVELNPTVQLPKMTAQEVTGLTGIKGRPAAAIASGQRAVSGAGESFISPEAFPMFISPPAVAATFARAFIGQMVASLPESLKQASDYYKAGDKEKGDEALINAGVTAGMLAVPAVAGRLKKPTLEQVVGEQQAKQIRDLTITGKELQMPQGAKPPTTTEQPYASTIESTKQVPEHEIRPPVGQETPLRQSDQGTTIPRTSERPSTETGKEGNAIVSPAEQAIEQARLAESEQGAKTVISSEERKNKINRLNQLKPELKRLSDKGGLTENEAQRFRQLSLEANTIRYELVKPLELSKIPGRIERKSTIPSDIVLIARNDLLKNKQIYDPVVDSAVGVYHGKDTPVDDIMMGKNLQVTPEQFYDNFKPTREAMRSVFGDTIKLFRSEGQQKSKATKNWATTKEYAEQFGGNVISKEIPIDDVLAINVGISGKYHELIVGKKPKNKGPVPSEPVPTPSPVLPEGTLEKAGKATTLPAPSISVTPKTGKTQAPVKQPWEMTQREYESRGMYSTPEAEPVKNELADVENKINTVKSEIHKRNPKYVNVTSLSPSDIAMLESGKITESKKSLVFRKSTIGASYLASKDRPYEWATRDKNPEIRTLAKSLIELNQQKIRLGKEIDKLSEHSAWIDYAKKSGIIKTTPSVSTVGRGASQALASESAGAPTTVGLPDVVSPASQLQILGTKENIKVTVPKEATVIRVTPKDKTKGQRVYFVSDLNSGEVTAAGGEYSKVEAGTIGKDKKFKPVKGEVTVEDKTPKMTGLGAAVPSEFERNPNSPTAMKYKLIDEERQKRGLPPLTKPESVPDQVALDKAIAKIDQDPSYGENLIEDINSGRKKVIEDWESHVLMLYKIDVRNQYARSAREAAQAYEDGRIEDMQMANARTQEWSNELEQIEKASRISGSARGRALRSLQVMVNEDYSLASLEMKVRAARGGKPITILERAELQKIADEWKAKADQLESQMAVKTAEAAEKAVQEALARITRETKPVIQFNPKIIEVAERIVTGFERRADAAAARLKEKLNRLNVGVDPTIVMDLAEIGVAKLARGGLDLAKWSKLMMDEYGPKVKPFLEKGYEAAKKLLETDLAKLKGPTAQTVKKAITRIKGEKDQLTGIKENIQTRLLKNKDISVLVQKAARIFVETGTKEREALIDKVHEFLKEIMPEITRRETMDAISGYGDFKQLSREAVVVELRGMKGEMQQLAKLEDMAKGQPPLKSGVERRTPTEAERQLIKKVNEAKFAFQVPMTDPATQLKSALDTYKTNLKNRITDYEDRLKRGDYSTKPRRELQLDKDALKLRHELDKIKRKFHELLIKEKLANQNAWQRAGRFVGEVINTMRALKASMDLSATLRQGGIIVASHPIRGAKVIPDQLKALVSPAEQFRVEQEILARPNYPLYDRVGLNLTEHGQKLSQMEEAYMSRWAEHIPGVAASQRAYTVFLNKLRADSFDAMADWVTGHGKRELTLDEGRIIANYINVATGRGNIGLKDNALVGLNTTFFAPRLVASRFQFLLGQPLYHGLFSGKTNLKGSLRARTLIAGEYARFLIAAGAIYSLASLAGYVIEDDPRSSDFGKIQVGNTRVDPMAGLIQTSVLMSRVSSGETKTQKGAVIPIRGQRVPYGTGNTADVIARFLRTKLSPAFGTTLDVLTGKNVVGQPVTPQSVAVGALAPLSLSDIYAAMKEQGIPAGSALGMLSILGVGIQTYNNQKPAPITYDPKIYNEGL